jgi:PAS domain S-box-containing protein
VKHLPSEKDLEKKDKTAILPADGRLEFGGRRAFLMDAAGCLYSLKKTLRSDIGFFEGDFMMRAGQEGATNYFREFHKSLKGQSPKDALKEMLGQISSRGYGEFRIIRLDEKTMIADISSSNTVEAWAFQTNRDMQREPICSYTTGILTAVCSLAFSDSHMSDVEFSAVEVECGAQGDKECRFVVGPTQELPKHVPSHSLPRDSVSEHVLKLNEEILLKNLELQSLNLTLERQVRKRTEDLRRSEDNYRRLVELSPDPILICTPDGVISSINESGLRLMGYDSITETEGLNLKRLLPDGGNDWEKMLWQLEKEGAVHDFGLELTKKDGSRILGEISARFADLITGRCVEAIVRDVTERNIFKAQIVEAKSESEFLNDLLSHDITNFATSALYFIETLRKSESLTEQDRRTIAKILKDIQGAFELSTSVRDLSRLKSMSEEDVEVKELQQLIAEGIEEAVRLLSDRRVRVNFERSSEPMFMRGNPVVSRLFTNLLTNAVKFDSHEEAVVDIAIESEVEKGVAYWRVSVSDRGKGIPQNERERVFERFHRLDASTPGTGLGLYVVRFVTDACGGRVWAEDRVPGDHTKGTRMVVLLQKATQREVAEDTKSARGYRV